MRILLKLGDYSDVIYLARRMIAKGEEHYLQMTLAEFVRIVIYKALALLAIRMVDGIPTERKAMEGLQGLICAMSDNRLDKKCHKYTLMIRRYVFFALSTSHSVPSEEFRYKIGKQGGFAAYVFPRPVS